MSPWQTAFVAAFIFYVALCVGITLVVGVGAMLLDRYTIRARYEVAPAAPADDPHAQHFAAWEHELAEVDT